VSCSANKSSTISVRVRSSLLSTGGDELEISRLVVHEHFDKHLYFNDIALMKVRTFPLVGHALPICVFSMSRLSNLQLKSPAEFGEKLLPVTLPEREDERLQDGTLCIVTGWNRTLVNSE